MLSIFKKNNTHDYDNNTSSIFIFVNDKLSSPKSSDDVQSEKRPPDRLVCHNFQDCRTSTLTLLQDAIITRAECISIVSIFEVFLSSALSAVGIEAQTLICRNFQDCRTKVALIY